MGWIPANGWLTQVTIDADAPQLSFDLAVDASGAGHPSRVMAGLDRPGAVTVPDRTADALRLLVGLLFTVGGIGGILLLIRRQPPLAAA